MNIYNELRIRTQKFLPRRFHCYCIGAAKTATTSISSMFRNNYDSAHEPDILATNRMIINHLEQQVTTKETTTYLINRDKRLRLEMESTHSLIYVSKELSSLFPRSKFIITVREPFDWIKSRINFHFKKSPPDWEEYRQYFWMAQTSGYAPEEDLLQKNGLASLDAYLSQYNEHYQLALSNIPNERRLFIKMNAISDDKEKIANFLNINKNSISVEHSNSEPDKASFISEIDELFVLQKIWAHCEPLISEFFPEKIDFYKDKLHQSALQETVHNGNRMP